MWRWTRRLAGAVLVVLTGAMAVPAAESAEAATTVENEAVSWATNQIGSTAYYGLCLTLVQRAYQDGADFNIQPLTNYGNFNSNTYPQQVWDDGFNSGTTGGVNTTPPVGALVFFNDPSNYTYSHVMISLGGGNNVSAPDAYNESDVHYETLSEEAASGAYAKYVGWWLPDGSGSTPPPNGTYVSYDGNGYAIAGGAPLYVSNWAAVGNPSVTPIDTTQWDSLSPVPANGTVLDTSGGVFVVAGGAPLYLSSFNAVPGSDADGVRADYWDVVNDTNPLAHLNPVPSNGTVLDTETGVDDGGGVYVVAGGAPLYLSNFDAVPGSSTDGVVVDNWDIVNDTNPLAHLNPVPSNGTVLDTSGGGGVFVVAGGAPLYLSKYSAVPGSQTDGVAVDDWDVVNDTNPMAHLNPVPESGSFIRVYATGAIYRVVNGHPFYLLSCAVLTGGCGDYTNIDGWDVQNETNPAAHLRATVPNGTVVEGMPSKEFWRFESDLRSRTGDSASAVQVDDSSLDGFEIPVAVSTTSLPSGRKGAGYSRPLAASGGRSPYSWKVTAGSLPKGLKLSAAGVLSGRPSAAGTWSFTVQVTDSTEGRHLTAHRRFTLKVAG